MAPLIPEPARARRLVVKIGSALLVDRVTGALLKTDWVAALAGDVARIKARGTGRDPCSLGL